MLFDHVDHCHTLSWFVPATPAARVRTTGSDDMDTDQTYEVLDKISSAQPNKRCILAGTLYKEMKLKPCILDEYAEEEVRLLCCPVPSVLRCQLPSLSHRHRCCSLFCSLCC